MTVRRLVVGRRLAVRLDDGDLTLTVTEFDSRLDVRGLSVGQLNDVRLAARDIPWHGIDRPGHRGVAQRAHEADGAADAGGRSGRADAGGPAAVLDDLFLWAAPRLSGEVGRRRDRAAAAGSRPMLGHLEVMPASTARHCGSGPAAWVRRSRWRLPARTPAYPVRLPEFPHGLVLTGINFAPHVVCLSGALPEWRMEVPRKRLEDIINQLSVVGVPLNLTRLGRLLLITQPGILSKSVAV